MVDAKVNQPKWIIHEKIAWKKRWASNKPYFLYRLDSNLVKHINPPLESDLEIIGYGYPPGSDTKNSFGFVPGRVLALSFRRALLWHDLLYIDRGYWFYERDCAEKFIKSDRIEKDCMFDLFILGRQGLKPWTQ